MAVRTIGFRISAVMVAAVLLGAGRVDSSTTRWNTISLPLELGRDDASLSFFPALLGETPAGLYTDLVGSGSDDFEMPRFLWTPAIGGGRFLLGVDTPGEVRIGAAGCSRGPVPWGIQAWGRRSGVSSTGHVQDPLSVPFTRVSDEAESYGGSLGLRIGAPERVHVDAALGLATYRNRTRNESRRPSLSEPDSLLILTEPAPDPGWLGTVMVFAPWRSGWLRGFAHLAREHRNERLVNWEGRPGPPIGSPGSETTISRGDIAWLGPIGRIDLFAAGISLRRTRSRAVDLGGYSSSPRATEQRDIEARLYAGIEVWPTRWLGIRAGGSRSYLDTHSSRTRWNYRDGGYIRSMEFADSQGLAPATTTIGVAFRHEKVSVDFQANPEYLLALGIRRISISYLF